MSEGETPGKMTLFDGGEKLDDRTRARKNDQRRIWYRENFHKLLLKEETSNLSVELYNCVFRKSRLSMTSDGVLSK